MKKHFMAAIAVISLVPFVSKAQWQGTSPVYYTGGYVGIGTPNPVGTLHVKQNTYDLLTSMYSFDIGLGGAPGGWARAFRVVNSANSNGQDGGAFGVTGAGTTPSYTYMAIPTSDPTGYDSPKILVLDNNGKVGIGTTNPISKLHINTSSSLASFATIGNNDNGVLLGVNSGGGTPAIYTYSGKGMIFGGDYSSNPSIQMVISNTGKVGIGTTTPDELLSVNGTIHSKEVKVNLTGLPDYVFKTDYHLPTLAEVKSYIDKNSHLPEMPSAQEVEKNGLSLGEMNKLLLKKVEELTLYLIEQKNESDKKNEQQQRQIDALVKQLETLIKTSLTKNN
ncbi:hypothetical protein [Mucilaginibacter boryungensis]|uniref:Uncharacterized protein n=1 Tax=Mucilaginibacter boryungensis TaxID=768480 RepID=A0ABR9XLZ2_9SPHI|nr:hypothetical protein [Mucilaginibacter boryungensis]MBE9668235.1 hypothetical protein [Mucilaginibacter boryungensis]